MNLPSERVFSCKESTAVVASVISLLHMDTLVMSLQVGLANKLLVAVLDRAREWIFAAGIMCLHVRLEIVASPEELATSFDVTLEVCIFFRSQSSSSSAGDSIGSALKRNPGSAPVLALRTSVVVWNGQRRDARKIWRVAVFHLWPSHGVWLVVKGCVQASGEGTSGRD